MEIKMEQKVDSVKNTAENPALEQIQQRGYSKKYRNEAPKGLIEVGLVFSGEKRNLVQADCYVLE